MISAGGQFEAIYSNDGSVTIRQVIAWADDGYALVLDPRKGQLVKAERLKGFKSVGATRVEPKTCAVPGGGWMFEFDNGDGTTRVQPVVAWVADDNGTLVPCNLADDGNYASEISGDGIRVFHPDATGGHGLESNPPGPSPAQT